MYNRKSRHIRRRNNIVKHFLSNEIIPFDYLKSKENITYLLINDLSRELVYNDGNHT
jgi:hypothetical protein